MRSVTDILLIAPLPLDEQRMGPAIRYWEFARTLSGDHDVTLLVNNEDHPCHPEFAVRCGAEEDLASLLNRCQVVVVQGPTLQLHPGLAEAMAQRRHFLVVDLYDPISLEQLFIDTQGELGRALHLEYWALLREQLRLGDFFLCASERQRDHWLGWLAALGRVSHDTWDGGSLRRMIDVVPFGLPAEPPQPAGPVLKGRVPGIGPDNRVILWGGGLWDWLDPLTPVRAMEAVARRHEDARLVFFDAARARMPMLERTRQIAAELGLLDRHVFFVPWLPPGQWPASLLEADIGLSFHPAGMETRLAFRTRLLDYVWAGLPTVTAEGDVLSELIAARGLGTAVPPGDEAGLAAAICHLLDEHDARGPRQEGFRALAAEFQWERVCAPLAAYCREPWHAGDAGQGYEVRWQEAQRDHWLSEAARSERLRFSAEARAAAAEGEQARAAEEARHLEARVATLSQELRSSEERYQAAMNGRVMRLLTGLQRSWRHLRGRPE